MNATVTRLAAGLLCCASASTTTHVHAATRRIELAPTSGTLELRAYGIGFLPLDGQFSRFHGWFEYDPNDHANCRVELQADVISLQMEDASTRDTIIGPDFIDAARYPILAYAGTCQGSGITGELD